MTQVGFVDVFGVLRDTAASGHCIAILGPKRLIDLADFADRGINDWEVLGSFKQAIDIPDENAVLIGRNRTACASRVSTPPVEMGPTTRQVVDLGHSHNSQWIRIRRSS